MSGAVVGGRILTPDEAIDSGVVAFDAAGQITAVGADVAPPPGTETFDARGLTISPGFIDLHVHGGGGFSLDTRDPQELQAYARWVVAHGVTSFVATVCAGSFEEGLEFVRTAAGVTGSVEGGATILGVNLEGPFVNPARRGALPEGWPAEADPEKAERLLEAAGGTLRLITVAPELNGAVDLIELLRRRGAVVSVGHTDATYDEALAAYGAGASHLTHAFNGMRPFHHRDPGPVFAAIDSPNVTLEIITDGVHVHLSTMKTIVRAAGADRVTLVTDAVPPAGMTNGSFRLGKEEARLAGNQVLLPDGTIAGSAATMSGVVRNVVDWGIAGVADAVRMASTVPARVLGLSKSKARIAPGCDGDLVALDDRLEVVMTWVGGRLVYARGGEHFN
jgi:N-acetylglucosamine-6-phosphate deacetylase